MPGSTSNLLMENIYWWEKNHPNKLYFTQPLGNGELRNYTWAEVVREARTMAAYFRSLNLPEKTNIALISKNCAHWIITDIAIWMAGHVTVPLYPTLTADSARDILEHSESKILVVGKLDDWKSIKPGVPASIQMFEFQLGPMDPDLPKWDDIKKNHKPIEDSPTFGPDEMASIVYTSGSTGKPKGVMWTHGLMGHCAKEIGKVVLSNENDRYLSYLPLAHAFERVAVETHSFMYGPHIFFAESLDTFIQDLQRASPTIFVSVPRLWLKFKQGISAKIPEPVFKTLTRLPIIGGLFKKLILKKLGLQDVRFAATGSAPIPPELVQWYNDLGLELLEGYGMTENFAFSHFSLPGKARVGYVGNTLPGVECRISEIGEIEVKSPGNTTGYYKEPEMTKELFTEDGFIKTGDQGEVDSEGRLRITGRVKELFKTSKGKYIAPSLIENKILATNLAEQVCVTGSGQMQPYALLVLSEELRNKLNNNEVSKEELETELSDAFKATNNHLAPHERLQFMVVVKKPWLIENGLLTPTMKIKRTEVEKVYRPHEDQWYKTTSPVVWEQ